MSPSLRAAVLMALAVLSVLWLPLWASLLLVGAVVLLCAVDWAYARRRPEVERDVDDVAARGVPSPLHVSVPVPPLLRVTVRQAQPVDVAIRPSVQDGGLQAEVVAARRGEHLLPPVAVRTTGPLRLARQDRTVGEPAALRVYPDLPNARRLAHQVRTGRFHDPGERPRGPRGLGTEFESIREYQPDDDVRQINWRATARAQHPMTNQYRLDTERDVTCAVDAGRLMAAPLGDRTRLDLALDAVAAVAATADVLGDRCGGLAFDAAIRRSLRPARRGGRALVDALYDLEPSDVDSDYELAFATLGSAKRGLVMVFTDLLDEAAARPMAEVLPILARRHAVVVASVRDSDVEAAVTTVPTAARQAYAMAVAADVLGAREAAAARLRRAGVTVVDALPDALPSRCVGAYLALKSRAAV